MFEWILNVYLKLETTKQLPQLDSLVKLFNQCFGDKNWKACFKIQTTRTYTRWETMVICKGASATRGLTELLGHRTSRRSPQRVKERMLDIVCLCCPLTVSHLVTYSQLTNCLSLTLKLVSLLPAWYKSKSLLFTFILLYCWMSHFMMF